MARSSSVIVLPLVILSLIQIHSDNEKLESGQKNVTCRKCDRVRMQCKFPVPSAFTHYPLESFVGYMQRLVVKKPVYDPFSDKAIVQMFLLIFTGQMYIFKF